MRLIDADALETHETYNGEWVMVVFVDDIDAAPTIEAEPVRHGKWIAHKDYPGLAYLCSKCNYFTTNRSYYCPHCGAKMDGAKIMATTNLTVPIVINWKDIERYLAQHDIMEVVRCENCRWGREVCGNIECCVDSNIPPEYHGYEWFCPNGDRRTDETG